MASSSLHSRRNSMDEPLTIADVIRLRDEFIELYERDFPQLQWCIKKLRRIIKTFEDDFRDAAKVSRGAGVAGIAGGTAVAVGLLLAPFTFGASVVVAGAGAATLTGAGIKSTINSFDKKHQMTELRKEIEAELKDFQDKLAPMAEKMKDIHKRVEKILSDLKNLEQKAGHLYEYFDATGERRNIRIEDLAEFTGQMSGFMQLVASIVAFLGGFSLFLDMISFMENSRALDDMEKLEKTSMNAEIDESEMKSKAGKFIVEMRKLIPQLQNIIDELTSTKQKMEVF